MSIAIAFERLAARADRFVTNHEPFMRSLTSTEQPPKRGECRHDRVVFGILGGMSALVIASSVALIALRYSAA